MKNAKVKDEYLKQLESVYIIDSLPEIDTDAALTYSKEMTSEEKIQNLIQNLRLILDKQSALQIITDRIGKTKAITQKNSYNIQKDNLRDDGEATIFLLRDICNKKHGMFVCKINLSNLSELFNEQQGDLSKNLQKIKHNFAIIGSNGKMYMVDCAYRQFFSLSYNINSDELEQIDCGMFMLADEKRKKVAQQILKKGYIELTQENLKLYLDGFVMATSRDEALETPTIEQYKTILSKKQILYVDRIQYENQEFSEEDSKKYIIPSEPFIANNMELESVNPDLTDEEKLIKIVQGEREYLMRHFNLNKVRLAGLCVDSTRRVILDCTSKGFESAMFLSPQRYLGQDAEGHNCTIVNSKDKSYLIDCTYRQFFVKKYDAERHCGYYMIQDEKRRKVAEQILKYGWIEATPENLKAYMDGFEMARKQSLEETNISPEEYVKKLEETKPWPIHIVTSREICNVGEESRIWMSKIYEGAKELEMLEATKESIEKGDNQ